MVRKRGMFSSKSRSGQVTVFIIIGILIVFTFAAALFLTQSSVERQIDEVGDPIIEEVPLAFEPVKVFTDNCLRQVGQRGLLLAGEQGGYIYPTVLGEFSESQPTEGNGVKVGSMYVPYWYHNTNRNEVERLSFQSHKPALAGDVFSIEEQLGRYVEEQLPGCLNAYEPFTEQGFSVEAADSMEVRARVQDGLVSFFLEMDVTAEKGNSDTSFSRFLVKVPLNLKRYYELAESITNTQEETRFLERHALQLVHIFSGITQRLPPTSASDVGFAPTAVWNVAQVRSDVKRVLSNFIPMLRFLGSENFYRYEYPVSDLSDLYQQTSDNMVLPLTGGEGLDITFHYLNWNPYVTINDKTGTIRPLHHEADFMGITQIGFQDYYNAYDVSYPVLVTIKDKKALNGDGYTFNLALESNVRNNRAATQDEDLRPSTAGGSNVCDDAHRTTELVRSIVIDSSTNDPLQGVRLGFQIPNQDYCIIGETNHEGMLDASYPPVIGGVVEIWKEGYLKNYYPLDTYDLKDEEAIIGYTVAGYPRAFELHPAKELTLSVQKMPLTKCIGDSCGGPFAGGGTEVHAAKPGGKGSVHSWLLGGAKRDLTSAESAVITFTRVRDLQGGRLQQDYSAAASVTGNEDVPVILYPGVYDVSMRLMSEDDIYIPEDERCDDKLIENCVTFEEIRETSSHLGTVDWSTEETYLVVTPQQLYNHESVTFYIPSADINDVAVSSRVLEDVQVGSLLAESTKTDEVRLQMQPTYR